MVGATGHGVGLGLPTRRTWVRSASRKRTPIPTDISSCGQRAREHARLPARQGRGAGARATPYTLNARSEGAGQRSEE
jgi:hypothetical protein